MHICKRTCTHSNSPPDAHVHAALILLDRPLALGALLGVRQDPVEVLTLCAVLDQPSPDNLAFHLYGARNNALAIGFPDNHSKVPAKCQQLSALDECSSIRTHNNQTIRTYNDLTLQMRPLLLLHLQGGSAPPSECQLPGSPSAVLPALDIS